MIYIGQTNESQVVNKMDVEGFEFYLLPHLLGHGALCGIDQILLEVTYYRSFVDINPQHCYCHVD